MGRAIVALIVLFFAITNIPWTLDDYDQAKQAYTSFEMVGQGHWFYQQTPNEGVATKPPLVGWVSAALFEVTRWWDGAWRLPSFLSAIILLWLIGREASAAYGSDRGSDRFQRLRTQPARASPRNSGPNRYAARPR